MTKYEMFYLTIYYEKIMSGFLKITEKCKKYLRNVLTNDILYLNTRFIISLFNLSSKGAGNYAL